MKKYLIILSALFITSGLFAQSDWYIGKFKVKKIGVSMGADTDMVSNLDGAYFIDQLRDDQIVGINDLDFDNYGFSGGVCENPHWRGSITLGIPGADALEWTNSLVIMPDRLDGVSYNTINDAGEWEYLNLTQTQDEVALETSLLARLDLGPIKLYGGAGTNLGVTFNNMVRVSGTHNDVFDQNAGEFVDIPTRPGNNTWFYDQYDTRKNFNQRVFLQGGGSLVFFKRVELGIEMRYGVGYRAAIGAELRKTNLISAGFTAKWLLK